jgi:2,4-dienoyl-CoA reductase-like NADH-dependent reductase (Old Yellow Enzyme family)
MNPMYLFRGGVPRREFAAQMPLPVRIGMRTVGKRFLREYPFEEAYFLERALRFREALTMSLVLLGGINRRSTMERAMRLGFQYVALGRALVHEPGLVARLAGEPLGSGGCIHCNRCMPTIYETGGTHCPVITQGAR